MRTSKRVNGGGANDLRGTTWRLCASVGQRTVKSANPRKVFLQITIQCCRYLTWITEMRFILSPAGDITEPKYYSLVPLAPGSPTYWRTNRHKHMFILRLLPLQHRSFLHTTTSVSVLKPKPKRQKFKARLKPRNKMKIAVEGCCHGELDAIYDHIRDLENRNKYKVDLLLICGDFQAMRNLADLQCMSVPNKYKKLGGFYK